jgi:MFS family permease
MIVGGRVRFMLAGRALGHRNYRLFCSAQAISATGWVIQALAQSWLIGTLVGWNHAVVYIGLLGVVQSLPVLALGLFGGIIADVWPKRRTLVGAQIATGLLALVLAALTCFGLVAVWHVFVLAFLLGLVSAVETPAHQSFIPEIVATDDVANAVTLDLAAFNGASIVGPAIAGVLIGVLGTAPCFVLNGLSRGVVIIAFLAMHERELIPPTRLAMPRSLTAVRMNLGESFRYIRHTPVVLLLLAVVALVNAFGSNSLNIVLPVMAANVFNVGSTGYGFLSATLAAGALTFALAIAALERPRFRVLIGGGIMLGVAELALAGTTLFPIALVAVFLAGAGSVASGASAISIIQITVPGPLRGRVLSVWTTVIVGSSPIGNGLTGGVGGLLGLPVALATAGAAVLATEAVAAAALLRGYGRSGGDPEAGATQEGTV